MAIVGHFTTLTEAEKLVQSELLKGVVQETYEDGQLLKVLPVMVINSKSIIYNRESTIPSADFYAIHEQIPWSADVDYATQVEVSLKRVVRQDVLDQFIMDTYKNPNDYRNQILKELRKGCARTLEQKFIYGDATTYTKQYDGLDKLVGATGGHTFPTYQDNDMGGAANYLSVAKMRDLLDQVKPRPTHILMTRTLRNRLSAAAWEVGIAATGVGRITYNKDDFGVRISYFDDIPIIVSDYLTTENDNTGGTLPASGNLVSVYAIKAGPIMDGGLTMVTGGQSGRVDMFKMVELAALEDYDAGGLRLVAYCALALGSTKGAARIHSVDQAGAVAA